METRSLAAYVTFDELNPNSGAGTVCLHEIEALKKVAEVQQVISRKDLMSLTRDCADVTGIPYLMEAYRDEAMEVLNS